LAIRKKAAIAGEPKINASFFSRTKPTITAGIVASTTRRKILRSATPCDFPD